ncbi:MAG: alpha-ketoglutarate-dependent dioxygenase AlkB, partial [Vulcanimicrobiaceae bacterium]
MYAPNLATGQQRADWFAALLAGAQWHSESRPMYDRVVDVPRLTAYFALDAELPPAVAGARALVETRFGLAFNSVGLNLY